MHKMFDMSLYYNPGNGIPARQTALMKSVFVRMGVRIRNVGPEDVNQTVGYLAGLKGFERQEAETAGELPVIPEQVLVLKGFSGGRLDLLLSSLRRAGVPKIDLKAVLTEQNSGWTFYRLYEEIRAEHASMTEGEQPPGEARP